MEAVGRIEVICTTQFQLIEFILYPYNCYDLSTYKVEIALSSEALLYQSIEGLLNLVHSNCSIRVAPH